MMLGTALNVSQYETSDLLEKHAHALRERLFPETDSLSDLVCLRQSYKQCVRCVQVCFPRSRSAAEEKKKKYIYI